MNMRTGTKVLLGLIPILATALWLPAAASWGATGPRLEPWADQPYQLVLCLKFSDDPSFTRLFNDAIQRQVRDQLSHYFDALAKVEVATTHPLWEKLAGGELASLSLSPADFKEAKVSGKVFLIRVDRRDGIYEIAWRQFDGDLEQAGTYRTRSTPDRAWVAKAICLAVKEDFAPVAIVTPSAEKTKVAVDFRGAALGTRLATWLGEDCVLAPYWVVRRRDGSLVRVAIPNTVLRMSKEDGPKRARVDSNLSNPWKKSARIVGFQAMKLHTQSGKFRLRVVDQSSGAPIQTCSVFASPQGFDKIGDANRLPAPDARGYVTATQPFHHVAYIKLVQGSSSVVQFPLPITNDWCELECKVPLDKSAGEKSDLDRQIRYTVQDLRALQTALDEHVREANELHSDKRYEESLRRVKAALDFIVANWRGTLDGSGELRKRAGQLGIEPSSLLSWVEEQARSVRERETNLKMLARNLESTIDKNDKQSHANVLIDLGSQAEREGHIDEAMEKYALALEEQPDQPRLKERLESMRQTRRIKSPAHEKARKFVAETWPTTEVTDVEAVLPQAEKALDALRAAGDYLAAIELLKANENRLDELGALVDQLSQRAGDEDRQEQEKYAGLMERLAEFQKRVADFIEAASSASGSGSTSNQDAKEPTAAKGPTEEPQETAEKTEQPANAPPTPDSGTLDDPGADEEEPPKEEELEEPPGDN